MTGGRYFAQIAACIEGEERGRSLSRKADQELVPIGFNQNERLPRGKANPLEQR